MRVMNPWYSPANELMNDARSRIQKIRFGARLQYIETLVDNRMFAVQDIASFVLSCMEQILDYSVIRLEDSDRVLAKPSLGTLGGSYVNGSKVRGGMLR